MVNDRIQCQNHTKRMKSYEEPCQKQLIRHHSWITGRYSYQSSLWQFNFGFFDFLIWICSPICVWWQWRKTNM